MCRSTSSSGRSRRSRRAGLVVTVACALAAAALLAPARAADDAPREPEKPAVAKPTAREPEPAKPPVTTDHAVDVGGRRLEYRAEAGTLPLLKSDGSPRANVFHVAYTLRDGGDPASRPITFCFNGGPGSSSLWLHLGGLGPRRARLNDDGSLPPPPFELVANAETILPWTDLVFIDPVSTGFSRAAKDERAEQFFGRDADIEAMAEFIRLYTTRHARWRSPKYLCGESYGAFRAAGLAAELQQNHGLFLNGLVLVSGLIDYDTILSGPCNDLPFVLFLPGYTAIAHHHGRLAADLQADLGRAVAEARTFADGELVAALHAGAALAADRRQAVAARIARLTGLPASLVLDHDLRIDPATFREKLLEDRRLICGRCDGRVTGRDGDEAGESPRFDPSYEAALGPLTAAMNAYVREDLGFESDLPYRVSTGVRPWPFEQNRYDSTARELAAALSRNPHLRVLVLAGLCDLAVPATSLRHSIDHLTIDPALRGNVAFAEYGGGHMMYLNAADRAKMRDDLRDFLARPATPAAKAPTP